jgi:hypothetical protein
MPVQRDEFPLMGLKWPLEGTQALVYEFSWTTVATKGKFTTMLDRVLIANFMIERQSRSRCEWGGR